MVDHIRTLLLNPADVPGYRQVSDGPADDALSLFGVTKACPETDAARIDAILPLAFLADLSPFRVFFDQRITPEDAPSSIYRHDYTVCCPNSGPCLSLSLSGLHDAVLGTNGWWQISSLFQSNDAAVLTTLTSLRDAAGSRDSAYALGAVLLACAYRRLLLQGEEG